MLIGNIGKMNMDLPMDESSVYSMNFETIKEALSLGCSTSIKVPIFSILS